MSEDHSISVRELHLGLTCLFFRISEKLPCRLPIPSRKECQELIVQFDTSDNGKLEYTEFKKMACSLIGDGKNWHNCLAMLFLKGAIMKIAFGPATMLAVNMASNVQGLEWLKKIPHILLPGLVMASKGLLDGIRP